MVERNPFTDQQIQDYIDGRLNERDRATVAAYLLAHPRVAADVEAVRRQSDALRALGHEILDEPVPEHLRRILRERRAPHAELRPVRPETRQPARRFPGFHEVVAAILLFCAGGAAGWFAHGVVRPGSSLEDMLLRPTSTAPMRLMAHANIRSPFRRIARKSSSRGSAAPSHAKCGPRIWTNSATATAAAG